VADPAYAKPVPEICFLLPSSEDKRENGDYESLGEVLTESLPGCTVFCRHNTDGDFFGRIADAHMVVAWLYPLVHPHVLLEIGASLRPPRRELLLVVDKETLLPPYLQPCRCRRYAHSSFLFSDQVVADIAEEVIRTLKLKPDPNPDSSRRFGF
jgi:hypothetical protein